MSYSEIGSATPWSCRRRWRFPSASEGHARRGGVGALGALVLTVVLGGCGDGEEAECGPGEETTGAVQVEIPGESLRYGAFVSSANNDCPPPEGGPTSLTIEGRQRDLAPDQRFSVVFCLPRPDEIDAMPVALDDERRIELVDLNAVLADGCRLRLAYDQLPASGTASFIGYCESGSAASGYALALAATAPGVRICPDGEGGTTEESAVIDIAGTVAVEALSL